MLRSGFTPSTPNNERRWPLAALTRLLRRHKPPRLWPGMAPIDARLPRADDDALPAIAVRAHYARCKRQGQDIFTGLVHQQLAPSMDFVRDWLMEERKRIFVRARWP